MKLVLAYDGTGFRGWAAQPGVRTVQGVMTDALERALGVPIKLTVAGRTDAGVHAAGQVASFEAPPDADPLRVQRALNGMLGPEIVVLRAARAPAGFHARHSATAREYLYLIETGPVPSPFTARFVWHRPGSLRIAPMRVAARDLVGSHDFASFCRAPAGSGVATVRKLERLTVSVRGTEVTIRARANAFLHQMVRSLVGTLVSVGTGRLDPGSMAAILVSRDRSAAGPPAPAHGLTFVRAVYARPS